MDDENVYAQGIALRTGTLEKHASLLLRQEEASFRKALEEKDQITLQIANLHAHIDVIDEHAHLLAQDVQHFVKSFSQIGQRESLETLQARADMLAIDQWLTKENFARLVQQTLEKKS